MAAPPDGARAHCELLTAMPPIHYNNDRDASDRLSSERLRLRIALSARARESLTETLAVKRQSSSFRAEAWRYILQANIFAEVVRTDGGILEVYSGGRFLPAAAPRITFDSTLGSAGTVPEVITLLVDRDLPLSSAHGNAPMRLAFVVCDEVMLSNEFAVCAKKGKAGQPMKKRAETTVPEPSAERRNRLRMIADAAPAPVAIRPSLPSAPAPVVHPAAVMARVSLPVPESSTAPSVSRAPIARQAFVPPSPPRTLKRKHDGSDAPSTSGLPPAPPSLQNLRSSSINAAELFGTPSVATHVSYDMSMASFPVPDDFSMAERSVSDCLISMSSMPLRSDSLNSEGSFPSPAVVLVGGIPTLDSTSSMDQAMDSIPSSSFDLVSDRAPPMQDVTPSILLRPT